MNNFGSVLPLLLLLLAFVVLIVLPGRARSRAAQRAQELQDSLTIGTEIMTTSGLYGRITELHERTLELEIAPGVVVQWARAAVAEVQRTEPAEPAATDEPTDEPAQE
ncbi:MAG TPA: preprotein translocase subunit YajC [Mycobacteriales bacterium]|nr:preprotein translocase subunit YajC [Mycobacteriales bacterium]